MDQILEILARVQSGENPPTVAELTGARTELARLLRAASTEATPDLEVLTSLRTAYDEAGTALAAAEAAAAEVAAAAAELLDGVEEVDPVVDGNDPADVDPVEDDPVDPEPTDPEATGNQPAPVRVLPLAEAAARVNARPAAPAPAPVTDPLAGTQTFINGRLHEGAPLDAATMARQFAYSMNSPGIGKNVVGKFLHTEATVLPGDKAKNTALVDQIVAPEAVAAAGGCCSLATPLRAQNVMSSAARPIRDSLPSFGVTESGAVAFFPAICLPVAGAGVWTCEDDEAVDPTDPETWKDCDFVDCATEQRVNVEAIYRCLTIGEYQRRFAPEQWAGVIQAVIAQQARVADAALFAKMLAEVSTTHDGIATGSIFANFIQSVLLAADTIRQDQRYENVNLRLWGADWIKGAIKSDLVARRLVEADDPVTTDQRINAALANAGVQVTYSLDVNIIEPDGQEDGPLTPYPDLATVILAPEGHFTYLDGGEFNLGTEIRDHDLARQNAVAAFAESFEGLLARGCNAKAINIPVEVCNIAAGCTPFVS